MRHFALRLVVALLTFAAGVTVTSLLSFRRAAAPDTQTAPNAVLVVAPSLDSPPPSYPSSVITMQTRVSGGVLNGKAISKPVPAYPPIAKAARAQGTVVVEIVVGESGDVISANAVSGHPLLQQAAMAAARQAKFSPTRLSGQPVQVSGTLTYNFVLE
jgi:periplasmic protein TonB